MPKKVLVNVPVFLFLINGKNQIYLQRRINTGFFDGFYEPPAGGMDEHEFPKQTACREAFEEAGIKVKPGDIELFHCYMNFNNTPTPYLGLMYRTRKWQGEPTITEPELCDDAGFYDLNRLPKAIPQLDEAIEKLLLPAYIDVTTYTMMEADGSYELS